MPIAVLPMNPVSDSIILFSIQGAEILFSFLLAVLAGSDFIVRKKGILGINNGGKHNAADIYQLAQATRKARDRLSVVSEGPR
jgi:hypothetical protein